MMDLAELLQWDRFITPSIVRVFYWLCLAMVALAGAIRDCGSEMGSFVPPGSFAPPGWARAGRS